MKSSGSVFTRQNPFQSPPRSVKAHYHPSRNQSLSKKEKKTSLIPVSSKQRSSPQLHTQSRDTHRLSEKHDRHFAVTDGQTVFAESWPSTECESPASSTLSSDMESPRQSVGAGTSTEVHQDSVLAKYVERFRRGPPQSREERQLNDSFTGEKQLPFWWMSSSSLCDTSTPTKMTDKDVFPPLKDDCGPAFFSAAGQRQHVESLNLLLDTSQGELDDTEILDLQQRANRLLLRDEYTVNDATMPVSSDGLGSSDLSSAVSVEEPLRRPLIPSMINMFTVKASSDSPVIPSLVTPTRPEEDILFQWRLRRKIEQAREWGQPPQHSPAFSWQPHPGLSHPIASGWTYKHQSTQPPEFSQKATHPHTVAPRPEAKEGHASCPPASDPTPLPAFVVSGSSVSQPQAIAHVPAHMHLLCDVLPCPIQSSHAGRHQDISQSISDPHSSVVNNKRVPGNSTNTFNDEPTHERSPSPPPTSSGALGEGPSHCERTERSKNKKMQTKETVMSVREQKKQRHTVERKRVDVSRSTNRSSSHQRVHKKLVLRAEQGQQKGIPEICSERYSSDYVPPPSPIHSALGQVVSEVLFPTANSSPARRTPVSSASPPCGSSPPPQSSVPPCEAQNSMEVISQLLQQAEDSDEKEFEDDPLLQVLRKQRTWVKEQISEVDCMLNELLDEQQVTPTTDLM